MKFQARFLLCALLAACSASALADQYEFQLLDMRTNRLVTSGSMVLLGRTDQKDPDINPTQTPAQTRFADMTRQQYIKSCMSTGVDLTKLLVGEIESGTEVILSMPDGDKPLRLQVVHTVLEKVDSAAEGGCTIQVPVVSVRFITGAVVSAPMNAWQSFPIGDSLVAELRRVN